MQDNAADIRYLLFDIETAVDGDLVAKTRYRDNELTGAEAVELFSDEMRSSTNSDFCPHTYHVPVCIVVAKIHSDFTLNGLVALDRPQFRSESIVRDFWRGWDAYGRPTLVTFNGRSFDLPVLELACFRYGISVPAWFSLSERSFDQARNRFNVKSHLDLLELLTNFGATRFAGGLNLAASLIGRPGKLDVHGHQVQELHDQGRCDEIAAYCTCDVLDTYFLFLRSRVVVGDITSEKELELIDAATQRLTVLATSDDGVAKYLQAMNA